MENLYESLGTICDKSHFYNQTTGELIDSNLSDSLFVSMYPMNNYT